MVVIKKTRFRNYEKSIFPNNHMAKQIYIYNLLFLLAWKHSEFALKQNLT